MTSRPPIAPLLILCGTAILVLIIVLPLPEKAAILTSTLGLLSVLLGVHLLGGQDGSFAVTLTRPWLRYVPLVIGVSANLLSSYTSPAVSTFAFAAALTLLLPLSKATNVSKTYIGFVAVFLIGSIAYSAFYYYPPVMGTDPLGYLSVASAIRQTGTYSGIVQPTDSYYFPFPVMSVASAILSSVSGLDLLLSILVFPGSLILLQSLFVFLLSRTVFGSGECAALAALVLLTEPPVTQWISAPIAQSTAASLLLIILTILYSRVPSRSHVLLVLLAFLTLVAIHGAVGLVSVVLILYLFVRERSSYRNMVWPLALIFLAYIMIVGTINAMVNRVHLDLKYVLQFIVEPSLRAGQAVYGPGTPGLIFVSWGLPVSLALFLILVERRRASYWAYAGLGLLGLSFATNVIAPTLTMDRYGGLCAWLILAVCGGKALSLLTRSRQQVFALTLILLLVSLSGVANPSLSPQYAHEGFQGVLPTTEGDRTALDWVDNHVIGNVFADSNSAGYLTFSRYQSGMLTSQGITMFPSHSLGKIPLPPRRGDLTFIRWSDMANREIACRSLASASVNQGLNQLNIMFDNSCALVEG